MNKLNQTQINKIEKKILINDVKLIVSIDVAGDKSIPQEENNKNIYCINNNYEIVWQVNVADTPFNRDSFVNIELVNDELHARKFSGFEYIIDINSGIAKKIGWDK